MIVLRNNSNHCYHVFSTNCMPGTELGLAHFESTILICENNDLNSKEKAHVSTWDNKVHLFGLELLKR